MFPSVPYSCLTQIMESSFPEIYISQSFEAPLSLLLPSIVYATLMHKCTQWKGHV